MFCQPDAEQLAAFRGLVDTGSKGASTQLTKVVAVEFSGQSIRANAAAPGVAETDILKGIVENGRQTLVIYGRAYTSGRVARPEKLVGVIGPFGVPAASFISGALVTTDGGYTAR